MAKLPFSSRRSFLKGSAVVAGAGAAGGAGAAVAAEAATAAPAPRGAALPTENRARAEAGPLPGEDSSPQVAQAGSDLMVDLLRLTDISYVAAMPGSTFRGLQESIVNYAGNRRPELITCVHEEISAAFAHGYAKVAGKPMACLVHSNVGLQHASMAIYNAWCDRVPMLVLAGNGLDAASRRPWVEWLHSQADLGIMVRDFTKWDDTPVSLQHYAESYVRGYEISTTPPCAPVLLVVDIDLQEKSQDQTRPVKIPRRGPVRPPAASTDALKAAAEMILAAERPVIVADRAARTPQGMHSVVALAELLVAPVIDKGGRLNMPTNHYLNQSVRQRELIRGADLVLGLELTDLYGLLNDIPDLPERVPRSVLDPRARTIAISANAGSAKANVQDLQRYSPADLTIAADAETCLPDLIAAIRLQMQPGHRSAIAARGDDHRRAFATARSAAATEAAAAWDLSPISTARMWMELWEQIKSTDWALVSNTVLSSSWPQRLWDISEHHQFIGGEGGYGVGYGAPAAAGAALAHRDAGRISVAVIGDGDLMVLPGALWTMAHHRLPLLTLVHNNRLAPGNDASAAHVVAARPRRRNGSDGHRNRRSLHRLRQVGEQHGRLGRGPVHEPDKLAPTIARALQVVKAGKPALIDVVAQPR